jgi:hypothetical protein
MWERPPEPPSFRLQPRDLEILELVFRHRFLQPAHVHALFPDGSPANLNRRLKLLFDHGYLERPRAQRPTKILTEEIVYALGNKGARLLEQRDPRLRIGRLEWNDRGRRPLGYPYIDHQLGVATVFVALEGACRDPRAPRLAWPGHYERRRYKIAVPGADGYFLPDGYFSLVRPHDGKAAHHFVEVMRSSRTFETMQERYANYFRFWRDQVDRGGPLRLFRVLTIAPDERFMATLRRAAAPIGRANGHGSWRALWFTHLGAVSLREPLGVLGPIFRFAEGEEGASLLDGLDRS